MSACRGFLIIICRSCLTFDLARLQQDSARLDVGTFASYEDLRDKSPQDNHNRDINLACFKLNGVLDVSESVLIPIIFFKIPFCQFIDVPMDNNDVNLFWCFRLLHSRLKIETRMQTKTTSKQHFIPGANYMNRRLIIIRRNKRSGKLFAFDDMPTRFYGRSFVNRVDGDFSRSYRILFYLWETCTELENKSASPLLVSDFPVTLP